MSFKDKEAIIRRFANEYNKSKIIEIKGLELLNGQMVCEGEVNYIDSIDKYTYYYSLQTKIECILDKLDWEYSSFMKKEFFTNHYYPYWWVNYYSRSTYYRIKRKSMEQFLGLLYA
jgi:hypothetical protein